MAVPAWVAKAAVAAVKNPEETFKTVIKVIIGVVVVFLTVVTLITSMISALVGEQMDADFDIEQTRVYQEIDAMYPDYEAQIREQMDVLEEQIIEENTYIEVEERTYTSYEGVEVTEQVAVEKCDIEVIQRISKVSYAYVLAYVTHMDTDTKRGKRPKINKGTVTDMLESITTIQQYQDGDIIYLYNTALAPDEVASMYFGVDTPEYDMFIVSFELYVEMLGMDGIITDGQLEWGEELAIDAIFHNAGMNIPHYFQNDYKQVAYGGGTISSSGCAPTCIAMVASYLNGKTITPPEVARWAGKKYYTYGVGSSWSIFGASAKNYGFGCNNLGKNYNAVFEAVEDGRPVIASMAPGTFTRGGHFIVIRGITSDGYFLVNDPNKNNFKKYGTDRFLVKTVLREAKNFWSFG